MNKRCSKCGVSKNLTEFYKRKASRDGHSPQCKVCALACSNAWYQHPEVKAKAKARTLSAHSEVKARKKARDKVYSQTPKGKKRSREGIKKYRQTAIGKAAMKAYRQSPEGKAVHRKSSLVSDYGITIADYTDMLLAQNGVCAICGLPETTMFRGKLRHLGVDHNHTTGKVRGLLCSNCNIGLGVFKEKEQSLRNAISYLIERGI